MKEDAEVVVAMFTMFGSLLTLVGVVITIIFSAKSHSKTAQINDAVNNVHAQGGKRIYDIAIENSERLETHSKHLEKHSLHLDELVDWRRSYKDSPWIDGEKVNKWLKENEERISKIENQKAS